ncbi:MAG: hypothetical protein H0V61_07600 [Chitinophagales bacterium]|nr:hypothetical protein [Chitinophagales bacterium]
MRILDNDLTNIKNIQFKIDKDFVRAENVKYIWSELFRQAWQEFSRRQPVPVLDVWKRENHPINEISESIEGMIAIKKIFRQNSNFYDSQDHWEIRLADIVGTILHRYQNRGVCEHIAKKVLGNLGGEKNNYMHLILADVH